MFRKIFVIAATTAALGGLAGPALAATPSSAHTADPVAVSPLVDGIIPVSHANTVTLNNTGVSSMEFTPSGAYSITSGQPWEGVSAQTTSSGLSITAQAGRHDSSGPAQWFTQNSSAMVGGNSYSASPSELNFAFSGTLTLNGADYDVVIGQGSNGEGNNWWIGGEGWIQDGAGTIVSPDQNFVISDASDSGGVSENSFDVSGS